MHRAALLLLSFCSCAALAQPASVDADAFRSEAASQYRKVLAGLAAKGKLDDDAALLGRVRPIAARLIIAAAQVRPDTSAWDWEVHVTSDPSRGAFCMAGGKLMVGGALVRGLDLDDAELAMLLGHEIAHAVADHRRAPARDTMSSDPAAELREVEIAVRQESEADRIGMDLAHRAGWSASRLAGFFDKLAAAQSPGTFNSSHPSAAARAAAAKELARRIGD